MNEEIDHQLKFEAPAPASPKTSSESIIEKQQQADTETRKSRTTKKNHGQMYVTKSGHLIKEKACKQLEDCRKKCRERIKFSQQKELFEAYWKLGNHKRRIAYLSSLVDVVPKKSFRIKVNQGINRKRFNSHDYFLEINGERIGVCQKCFLFTFDETEQIVKTISKRKSMAKSEVTKLKEIIFEDKIADEQVNDHINSFPKYLSSDLTIEKMYGFYLETQPQNPVSYTTYEQIFTLTGIQIMPKPMVGDCCMKCKQSLMKTEFPQDGQNKEELKWTDTDQHQQDHEIKEEIFGF